MKDYTSYTLEDFVLDEDFCLWAKGAHTKNEVYWARFLQEHPEKEALVFQARRFVRATHVAPEALSGKTIREEVQKFLEAATETAPGSRLAENTGTPQGRRWLLWMAAACVVFVAVIYALGVRMPLRHTASGTGVLAETVNHSARPMKLVLADQSEILLLPGGRLRYPARFGGAKRTVYLSGEAVFSVAKNRTPFFIISGEMVTRVIGTRFRIRAYDRDKENSVQVQSGKVSVYASANSSDEKKIKGVVLTANQEAIFRKSDGNLSKTLVASPEKLVSHGEESGWEFSEIPLPRVLEALGEAYGITIQFDEERLAGCRITATFSNENLYRQLDELCKIASASYQIVDGQIVFSGNGCVPSK